MDACRPAGDPGGRGTGRRTVSARWAALELSPLSGLIARRWGFRIDSGQLDGELDLARGQERIDGAPTLRLNRRTVSTADKQRLRELEKDLPHQLKLQEAVRYLTDKNGIATLTVPVSGDRWQRQFGLDIDLHGAIKRAVDDLVNAGLLPAVPDIPLVGALAESQQRFAPVAFAPLQPELIESTRQWLDKVAKALTDKPEPGMLVCGVGAMDDWRALPAARREQSEVACEELPAIAAAGHRCGALRAAVLQAARELGSPARARA
jgi:hypothetical protein